MLSIVRTMRRCGAESEARMDNVRRGVEGSQGRGRRLRRDGVIGPEEGGLDWTVEGGMESEMKAAFGSS
ncbi:hypothetical protein PG993_003776 [Apiospora rasikravindrae]|uniref:Uncharacterized protein n=1 Tax=Apiospora rasikravindrae TaxID=990691 RepID=A0ABR1U0G4_9PEZI